MSGPANPASNAVPPLRIGVMLDSLVVPNWVARILADIGGAEFADLVLVVVNAERQETPGTLRARAGRFRRHGLFSLYLRFDFERKRSPSDAFEPVDVSQLVSSVRILRVLPLRPRPYEHRFDDFAIAQIRAARLDVVLRFGFGIIRGEVLDVARHGVWSYHHGDNRVYRGGPALFWEMYEGNPVSGTTLQILTEELDGGRVIYRSHSATDPVSLYRNRNETYWKTSAFMVRRLRDLHDRGWDFIASLPTYSEQAPSGKRIYRIPTNVQMLVFLLRIGMRVLRRRWQSWLYRGQWFVAYRKGRGDVTSTADLRGLRKIVPPRGRFFADPFVTAWNGRHVVFFEDFEYRSAVGRISCVELSEDGRSEPQVALEADHHLSYPFTFKLNGSLYMIPETAAKRTIELYSVQDFPNRWTLERVLMTDVTALDSTLLVHDGRFWLFANVLDGPGRAEDELFLFSSSSLDGEWVPHSLNPIVSDVRRARPAGRIFVRDGKLIRPAQDSSRHYGGAIVLNEIQALTQDDYREVVVGRIDPGWARRARATHCFSSDGAYEVIDGYRRRLKVPW
jgi:hypothetical protein